MLISPRKKNGLIVMNNQCVGRGQVSSSSCVSGVTEVLP
jgi:hypothetical protein